MGGWRPWPLTDAQRLLAQERSGREGSRGLLLHDDEMADIHAGQSVCRRLLDEFRLALIGIIRRRRPGLGVARLVVMDAEVRMVVKNMVVITEVVMTLVDGSDHQIAGSGEAEQDRQSGLAPARGEASPDVTDHDAGA